jgi:phospholipid/cholesterol/gamma-HCH transport system substrate-binding protein
MEKDADYFTVGLFVSLSILGLVGFLIWLMGLRGTGDYDRYTIYFSDPVSGLTDEAPVKYNGVEVGKVLEMRLSPEQTDLVKVDIEVEAFTPVSAETSASIAMQGITGQTYVELATATNGAEPPPTRPDEEYPILAGSGNALRKFLEALPALGEQMRSTLTEIDSLAREGAEAAEGIDSLAREGAEAAESVRSLADTLKEDPSQVIYPPSHRGVEIPR